MLLRNEVESVVRTGAARFDARLLLGCWALASGLCGCESGGVGDPCVPEEEYAETFSGFSAEEGLVETQSMQCETRVCLINHFQGRVSCPYGQTAQEAAGGAARCAVPGSATPIQGEVLPQLLKRRAEDTVYCSCRCDGPDKNARYCECPSGFSCEEVLPPLGRGKEQLVGSYCIREGTMFSRTGVNLAEVCDASQKNCE